MVDSTKGIGSVQGLISGTRVSEPVTTKRTADSTKTSSPKDEVSLSPEALTLSQVNEATSKIRYLLSKDTDLNLSGKAGFDESL